jgi:hypothetical protein
MKLSPPQFWQWFKENNKAYLFINQVEPEIKENLLNAFMERLHEYCDKLYFEIGGHPDEKQELIITADGNTDYFKQVEDLIMQAPQIEQWSFIAFIPPRDVYFQMNYEGVILKPEEMWFQPLIHQDDPSAIGLNICTRNYELVKNNEFFEPAVYKILDTILGEKVSALDVDYVSFGQLPDDPEDEGMLELSLLPDYIARIKIENNNHGA